MTWSSTGDQLVAVIDGAGRPELPKDHYASSRLFSLRGDPQNGAFDSVTGYPDISLWAFLKCGAPYYAMNCLSVDGVIYQYLCTFNRKVDWIREGIESSHNFNSAKRIYCVDNGRTWRNQDGTTPVVQEPQNAQSADNMLIFHEPQNCFSIPSFLQMGQDYSLNRDGYVYVYAPNGSTEGTMNELVLFRVKKKKLLDRGSYEFFAARNRDGSARGASDVQARAVVHTFPSGWVDRNFPLCWLPSVAYNAPSRLYMMANSSGVSANCISDKPSYFGLWVAQNPWGPWHQIHEESAWIAGGDVQARAAAPLIAPKWLSSDGRSFWLVWTDVQQSTSIRSLRRRRLGYVGAGDSSHPYFGFNAQRMDLVTK
jgi:hypothetical protein